MRREEFEIEVCANSVLSSIEADKGGAERVELCDNLYEGGTTPSSGMIYQTKLKTSLKVFPIIRPRGGDFLYSDDEINIMIKDIEHGYEIGADGFVIGCLTPKGNIDFDKCARLIDAAKGKPITFHRAFDMSSNPYESLEILKKLGIKRVLTSGMENKAIDGVSLLSELVSLAKDEISIMIGSGVTEDNIVDIATRTNAKAFHISLREPEESKMVFRREDIYMGGLKEIPEFSYKYTRSERVKTAIQNLLNN